jgi:hypothetical protein
MYAASALTRIGLVRNLADAGFHLFGTQKYYKLGNQGAASLLAGLAVLMVPIPFVLGWYARNIREGSPCASVHVKSDEVDEADEADEADETNDRGDKNGPKLGGKDSDN